jgi:hypothetical protein
LYLCVVCDDGSGVACVKVTALGKTEILVCCTFWHFVTQNLYHITILAETCISEDRVLEKSEAERPQLTQEFPSLMKYMLSNQKQGHCDDIMDALSTEEHGQVERIVARMEQLSEVND